MFDTDTFSSTDQRIERNMISKFETYNSPLDNFVIQCIVRVK